MMECSHDTMLSNQLIGIYASEIQPRIQLASAHALYVAVDRCRDMVHVTDDQYNVCVGFNSKKKKNTFKSLPSEEKNSNIIIIV